MSNYLAGHGAEKRAAEYLKKQGFNIKELNWKTRYCEIDVIAEKEGTVYFVEVKYRRSSMYGSGYEYISQRKLKQMSFAAEIWVSQNKWADEYRLAVMSVDHREMKFFDNI
jgi:uncharacterized protein (TIGR00252 family)